jgi:alpha-ketoglutarate-dependent taurine dioxygenase
MATATVSHSLESRVEFLNDKQLPAVIMAAPGESLDSLLTEQRESLAAIRRRHGAILFRGFNLTTAEDFHAASALAFEGDLRSYIGGVSPRGQVTAGVYESTRFPSHLRIPQHNEMSYLPDPPRELAFFCETPPDSGGETPLADSRLIYKLLPPDLLETLRNFGISYHRYLYGSRWNIHSRFCNSIVSLHTSWRAAFSTQDRAVVEQNCAESNSTVKWDREDGAKINNVLPAFRTHPDSGEMLWFNQVPTFISSPKSVGLWRWFLYRIAHPMPTRRPFHATFGDKRPITYKQLNAINQAIDSASIRFKWQRGDLLIVDNFLVTHGRMPFHGKRRILVAIH